MAEDLTNPEEPGSRGVLSGILITLLSALVAALFFALFFSLAYYKKMPYGKPQAIILQVTAALVAVGMTQFLSRKIQGDRLSFLQAFLGGWMSSLVLGMFLSFFYNIFFRITEVQVMPEGAFAMILMLFSLLGLFISLLLSFIFKKER
jgi:hypothetical protein